jgi:hypothetical protein
VRVLSLIVTRQITSLTAAPGWSARFSGPGGDERLVTLVAWALVDGEDGAQQIVGVVQRSAGDAGVGATSLADEVDGFSGYVFAGLQTRRADDA